MNCGVVDEIFKKRIIESNFFNRKEQEKIKEEDILYKKCYFLGILDKASSI